MAEVMASMEQLIDVQAQGKAWIAPKTNVSATGDRFMMATLAVAKDRTISRCRLAQTRCFCFID